MMSAGVHQHRIGVGTHASDAARVNDHQRSPGAMSDAVPIHSLHHFTWRCRDAE